MANNLLSSRLTGTIWSAVLTMRLWHLRFPIRASAQKAWTPERTALCRHDVRLRTGSKATAQTHVTRANIAPVSVSLTLHPPTGTSAASTAPLLPPAPLGAFFRSFPPQPPPPPLPYAPPPPLPSSISPRMPAPPSAHLPSFP